MLYMVRNTSVYRKVYHCALRKQPGCGGTPRAGLAALASVMLSWRCCVASLGEQTSTPLCLTGVRRRVWRTQVQLRDSTASRIRCGLIASCETLTSSLSSLIPCYGATKGMLKAPGADGVVLDSFGGPPGSTSAGENGLSKRNCPPMVEAQGVPTDGAGSMVYDRAVPEPLVRAGRTTQLRMKSPHAGPHALDVPR